MALRNSTVRVDPEMRATLVNLTEAYRARGVRIGWTSLLKRAASLGLPYVEREIRGGIS